MGSQKTVLILTSCTSRKLLGARGTTALAERLYAGEQHRRLMEGVEFFRIAQCAFEIDLRILSAGFGLIRGSRRLPLYDLSFSGMGAADIEARAQELKIPHSLGRLLSEEHALTLLLLGDDYMRAASIDALRRVGGPVIAFGGEKLSQRADGLPLRVIPARKAEARRFSCGLVGLKGELAKRLLTLLASDVSLMGRLNDPDVDVLGLLEEASEQGVEALA
jgi:hypothetical protein